jgi:hypothetical protein
VSIIKNVTFNSDLQDWVWIGWLDLLRLKHSPISELKAIQRYCYSTHFTFHRCTRTRFLSLQKPCPSNGFITILLSLRNTHKVFFAQPISFLSIILQLPILKTRLNSIPLLPSSYTGRLGSRKSAFQFRLDYCFYSIQLLLPCPFITPRYWPHKNTSLYCQGGVFTASLPSNGRVSVACIRFDGMCLPSHSLAMGIQVTILIDNYCSL